MLAPFECILIFCFSLIWPWLWWLKEDRYICFACKYTMTNLCSHKCPLTVTPNFVLVRIANKSTGLLQRNGSTWETWMKLKRFAVGSILRNIYAMLDYVQHLRSVLHIVLQYDCASTDLKSAYMSLITEVIQVKELTSVSMSWTVKLRTTLCFLQQISWNN